MLSRKRYVVLLLWMFAGLGWATTSSEYQVQQGMYNGITTYYLDPGKQVVLIHGDVITPIPIKKPGNYYELFWNGSTWVLNPLSESEWQSRSKEALTKYHKRITDFNGDGIEDLLLDSGSSRILVSGTGDALSVEDPDELQTDYQDDSVVGQYVENGSTYPLFNVNTCLNWGDCEKPTSDRLISNTKGEFQVTSSGSANYTVPLNLPEGRNGMTPALSIEYDSMGGESDLGIGFRLNAGSSIHRCTQNKALDNLNQRPKVQLSKADRLCIDGKRLFLLGTHAGDTVSDDAYWAGGATYYTEPDTFIRIKAMGTFGVFPKYFEVKDKQNRTRYYGAGHPYERQSHATYLVTDSAGQQLPYAWALGTDVDAEGNTIHYEYEGNATEGSHTLKKIRYTGYKDELAPFAEVALSYQTRKAPRLLYRAGAKITKNKLLTGLETKVDGELYRSYHLVYFVSNKPYQSRQYLYSLQECTLDNGKEACLNPVGFRWRQRDTIGSAVPNSSDSSDNIDFDTYETTITGLTSGTNLERLVDYDGDGKADLETGDKQYYNIVTGERLEQEYYPKCSYQLTNGEVGSCSNDTSIKSDIPQL